ncbi:hypothetical protein Tco_0702788 [Tanacetum coccineum]|uniref:Uncharacterized protein n=1 Tax=Tanacetum coccineum TaxID=301880 RepID=A0ABQ4XXT5_9ASTR
MNESRPGRCKAQNHIKTEMNESRTCRQQQIQTSDKQQTEHHIQTAHSDRQQQRVPNKGRRRAKADTHSAERSEQRQPEPKCVDAEMLHITTQDIIGLVKTVTSPSPSPMQNQTSRR